ncbi:MAG TPA: hypothetical protein VKT49_08210 [Bryobacteraceae bacterium]|nr:hypothetical protein [Bryobacteraceae bacterium]
MELAIAVLASPVLARRRSLRGELRAMWVEWRVRRGLRLVLAQEA